MTKPVWLEDLERRNHAEHRAWIAEQYAAQCSQRCPSVELAQSASDEDRPVWVQVARAGSYKGYAGGSLEFTLDRDVFDQVVANLRRHPSYRRGPSGFGTTGVIAWDFNHASEHAPTSGVLPATGAPAQGWVLDLDVRAGGTELWALAQWLEPARSYIKEGRYKWASISIVFDAVDPVSGESVGALLTSIALTNTPFIEGMQPLAASRSNQGVIAMSVMSACAAACLQCIEACQRAVEEPGGTPESRRACEATIAACKSCIEVCTFPSSPSAPGAGARAASRSSSGRIDLVGQAGANRQERAFSFLASTQVGWERLKYDEQWKQALTFARSPDVVDSTPTPERR